MTIAQFLAQYPNATPDDVERFVRNRDELRYTYVEYAWRGANGTEICGNEFTARYIAQVHFTRYEQYGPSTFAVEL